MAKSITSHQEDSCRRQKPLIVTRMDVLDHGDCSDDIVVIHGKTGRDSIVCGTTNGLERQAPRLLR